MRVDENNVLAIRALAGDVATTALSPSGVAQVSFSIIPQILASCIICCSCSCCPDS